MESKNICDAIVDEFSSNNMKSTSMNSILELKLICMNVTCMNEYTNETWEFWTTLSNMHGLRQFQDKKIYSLKKNVDESYYQNPV